MHVAKMKDGTFCVLDETETPSLLQLARLGWRLAGTADLVFVVSSWQSSALGRPFETPAHRVKAACGLRAAMHPLPPTLVVYDLDRPSLIVAWRSRAWCYTKQAFRRQGLQRALSAALDAV